MAFELPPLPYQKNALEPHISAQTLDFHYGKHHQAYVTNLNNAVKGTPLENQPIEELIRSTYNDSSKTAIFNNAAQVWNHTFLWNCMKPNGGGNASAEVAQAIDRDLGGFAKFKEDFKAKAVGQFGSGWAWWSPVAASSRSRARRMLLTRLLKARALYSPAMYGNTPIISIIRTAGPTSFRPSSIT